MRHPIEVESYRILRERVDTSGLPPLTRAVVERVIHATADLSYLDDIVCDEAELRRAVTALAGGAPIVVDAAMVAAGVTSRPTRCGLAEAAPAQPAAGLTRSAAGARRAAVAAGPGAVWVVGCAPTALAELIRLAPDYPPALVIGLPVGFVGAVEAKAALRAGGLPAISNRTEKGGSSAAAAALNALLYLENT